MTYLILGAGVAGHFAAEGLRQAGYEGPIVLAGSEVVTPYDRPALSKDFLRDNRTVEDVIFQPAEKYREHHIELRLGDPASAVDLEHKRVSFTSGDEVAYDKLLIATGAEPIRLDLPGGDLPGVHYLRSLASATELRQALLSAEHVLVVGAGFIGCEVTASARQLGKPVTLIDMAPLPMEAALGAELGAIYAQLHLDHEVDLRLGRYCLELRGKERVERAKLDDGSLVDCDLVVVGIGVRPRVDLFKGSALAVDNGILVNEHCETTVPDVYAAGDVANWWHPTIERRLRVEHFDNAGMQGAAAAKVMAGQSEVYAPVPSFWTDQYDTTLQYYGYPVGWDETVLRGDPEGRSITMFYREGGRLLAAAMLNRSKEHRSARRLVAARAEIDPAVLADETTDLRELAKQFR